jgi:hypothetical protein
MMGPFVRINREQMKTPSVVGVVKISSASFVVISIALGSPTQNAFLAITPETLLEAPRSIDIPLTLRGRY